MLAILNYGIGNLNSILNILKKKGIEARITSDKNVIEHSDGLILPGVGHFDYCMQQFNRSGLRDFVEKKVISDNLPLLGVCVGCQMLMGYSEEGKEDGLGWLSGEVVRFKRDILPKNYKIPHMGWRDVIPVLNSSLYKDIVDPRFYFVHSFHVQTEESSLITGVADYGYEFPASLGKGNIQGVQFHPEKSHSFGMKLYSNFFNEYCLEKD